ncbi:tannase/feruloyl esterase family alpha/beta hydrolase [Hydrogenophaga palleronii]|uniref:tannase/feruloyl esterase family alpha/beta hydrolase n=1 Tax=Hydrogenophaga palleronii TaxID=65655 RepID=UPI000AF8FBEA|nr:tannase/feruloyl esterase family alpha/beta hydrolase [Hydrogenophaga palleronii]
MTQSHPIGSSREPSQHRAGMLALATVTTSILIAACGGGGGDGQQALPPMPESVALKCDESMKTAFKPDSKTTVVLVKAYKQGDPLALPDTPGTPPAAAADLCLVKLLVGPGAQDTPPTAVSNSAGIGIEVWLPSPANWNERIRNAGNGGFAGGTHASETLIGFVGGAATAATGFVVGQTDTGHSITTGGGSFLMRQDGSINTPLWEDFAHRSSHELALKTKALTKAFYQKDSKYAYFEGCSTGGRQGYRMAQDHPEHYDGYVLEAPVVNWTKFISTELYHQVVMQQDLGGAMGDAKLNTISAAATSACDVVNGQHLGFITDPGACRYDPTKDASVLCAGVSGHAGVVGTSNSPFCVNLAEARAVNKMWFGQTTDGTYADPAIDNASTNTLAPNQLWWGLTRGTSLTSLAGSLPFAISTDLAALHLQNPRLAQPGFVNATGNGENGWRDMTYADAVNSYNQGLALQPFFGNINGDHPDLKGVRDRGAKIIHFHGTNDNLVPPAGSVNYYNRVSNVMGGFVETAKFNRLFLVPGRAHCRGIGAVSGSDSPAADANNVPALVDGQLFQAVVQWVENKVPPESFVLNSADSNVSIPICPYPKKISHDGVGPIKSATSYRCQ